MLGESLSDFISIGEKPFSARKNYTPTVSGDFRLAIIKIVFVATFLILLASLINTQIITGSYYRALGDGNRIRVVPIHAPRGIISDREGTALTANLPSFRLIENGESHTISKDQAISLEASGQLKEHQNLEIDSTRTYLRGKVFSHVLGYVSEINADELKSDPSYLIGDKIGRGGVEEFYQDKLRGKDGKELIEVDALGKRLRTISTIDPIPGQNLKLSIDARIQQVAYDAINGKNGAIIVTNPATGEIISLVSSPAFDPNIFTDFSLPAEVRSDSIGRLFSDPNMPSFNRAVGGTYPPGSTFKIVTATAGLETGSIKADTLIEDTGVLVVGPYKFPNWKWLADGGVEGNLDVVGAIQKSNDIFFYKTAEMTGIDNLVAWAKKFGLGARLGVDLPGEATGLIRHDRDWYLGDTYHEGIGQGDLLVTPLQDNAWTNVVANGGKLCTPHVYGPNNCKDLGIKPATINLIREGMLKACQPGGTGYPLYGFVPQVACKTGTAEFGTESRTHAWFTSYAPIDKPEISVTVLVEGAGEGSDVAAPIARKIYEAWFKK